jgi:putative DNA primase/helicase
LEDVKNIIKNLTARYLPKTDNGQVIRGFMRFALIAAAGEMATIHGIIQWELGEAEKAAMSCFNDWVNTRGSLGMQEEMVALAKVRKFFEQHAESRFTKWNDNYMESRTMNRAGYKRDTETGVEFYVFTETFKTEICAGLDHTFVSKTCINKGILMPDKNGNPTRSERLPGTEKSGTTRCYRFTKVLASEE